MSEVVITLPPQH
jgi:hypothetical protein